MTDTERLDFLDDQHNYIFGIICRWSAFGRGWRLHETTDESGHETVREAIDAFIKENGGQNETG